MPDAKQIAAAVNGYCKALRLLGREDAGMGQIAEGLGITPEEVVEVFKNWHIAGSKVSDDMKRQHLTIRSTFYPIVQFKRMK